MDRVRVATVWLGGCAGCHMSFLDMDEWLIDLADKVQLVYSPIADVKEYPENVDVCFVEGALANEDNVELMKQIRARTKFVVAFGDCAVTGNVPAMRNPLGPAETVLQRAYVLMPDLQPQVPEDEGIVPKLLDRVSPIGELVHIDAFLPGCPPSAPRIRHALEQLLAGEGIHLAGREIKFG